LKSETYYAPAVQLQTFMQDVFLRLGVPLNDASTCAEVLIASDLRGIESHGIGRLKMYYDRIKLGVQLPVTNFEIVRETLATAVVDGHHGMGQVIGVRAMKLAISKARTTGMGSVAVRDSTHFGIDGYYPLMAVKAGMIGMSFTNARPSIAPTFGVQPMLGTNPIAFGAPSDEDCPFLLDAATSITQRGKFEVLSREEKPALPGWAIDQLGHPITDPDEVLRGLGDDSAALLPVGGAGEELGGHKGYGLAVMVEILCSALQTGAFLHGLLGLDEQGNRQPNRLGHFFMAIDIEHFCDLAVFKKTAGDILRELRASTKAPGAERIYTCGEKEHLVWLERKNKGVPVDPVLQKQLLAMRDEQKLNQYRFPFEA